MPDLQIFPDLAALSQSFAAFLKEMVEKKPRVHVALSGGSTPKAIFDYMAAHEAEAIPWEKIHFFWGDERCVPPDHPDSNFGMARAHLFSKINIPAANLHRMRGEAVPEEEIKRYSEEVIEQVPSHGGVPRFDLVLLGLGDDGHTASIFPNQIALWHSIRLCEVATHPKSGQQRLTLTGKLIDHAQARAFLVTGAAKAEIVREVFRKEGNWPSYPAAMVNTEQLYWFLDAAAAAQLS